MKSGPLSRVFRRFNLWLSGLLVLVVWVLVVLVFDRPALKTLVDVTPQQRFSISVATEKLFKDLRASQLEEPVRIEAFQGPLADARSVRGRIERSVRQLTTDLLDRYDELGGEQVEVDRYDLRSDLEAIRKRRDELSLGAIDGSFLVVSIGRRKRVLREPWDLAEIERPGGGQRLPGGVQPDPRLSAFVGEEAISTAIRTLLSSGRPKIYFATGSGQVSLTAAVGDSYSGLLNILDGDGFEPDVLAIDQAEDIPDDAAIVAFLEPRALSDRSQQMLVSYVERGGRVFFNPVLGGVDSAVVNPDFPVLESAFGFALRRAQACEAVVDLRTNYEHGGPEAGRLTLDRLSPHPVTRPLLAAQRAVQMRSARVFERTASGTAPVDYEPILQTGPRGFAAPFARDSIDYGLPAPSLYRPMTVGAAFEWRRVDEVDRRPGRFLVFTGALFVNGDSLLSYNGDLALNVFNWLADRTELVTVRGNKYRPQLLEIRQPQVESTKTLLVYRIPFGLLVIVGFAALRRRSR